MALSRGARVAASASATQELKVCDVAALECVRTIRSPATAKCLALTASGAAALTADQDSMLRLWDLASGQVAAELPGHDRAQGYVGAGMVLGVAVTEEVRASLAAEEGAVVEGRANAM